MNTPYAPNNLTERPLSYYMDLFKNADPAETADRTEAVLSGNTLTLTVLGEERSITWPDFPEAAGWKDKDKILILRYLVEGRKAEPGSGFKSYNEFPWGDLYLRNFKNRCILRMTSVFGTSPDRFKTACENLGGKPTPGSGICYEIPFINNLSVKFILWEGDEEFPASGQILFSDNFADAFDAEDRVVVCEYILSRMK